ncbi:hypothetical protein Q73_02575 [Bacillus coahuilensis m2-6]|nr:hypothetical protein Q73_02575 [Bacillus coahuilensis m2-6]
MFILAVFQPVDWSYTVENGLHDKQSYNKKTLLQWMQKSLERSYHPKLNALQVEAPCMYEHAGCCEFIEPDLSFTLDKLYNYVQFTFFALLIQDKYRLHILSNNGNNTIRIILLRMRRCL